MKNKIYFLGLASVMLLSLGCMFKIMHWAGAGIMITLGVVLLCFAFIPAALISNFKAEVNKSQKTLYYITALVLTINLIGALFKIMHWPGASILLFIGIPLPFVLILPLYIFNKRNESEINYKNFLAVIFLFAYFAAISALLALNITKNVINGYVNTAISIDQKTQAITAHCQLLIQSDSVSKSKNAMQLASYANDLCNEIDSLVGVISFGLPDHSGKLVSNGNPNLWMIENKEGGVGDWMKDSFTKLKTNIIAYKTVLSLKNIGNKDLSTQFDLLLNTGKTNDDSWENEFIKDKTKVSGIEKLYLLKHQVRLAEWQALSE
jgi:hypothetical protein